MSGEQYLGQRALMVEQQLRGRSLNDERVLRVMADVPRHLFVPENMVDRAYEDRALPIGSGQTISQPYMVASMTEQLALKGSEKVLEIGTGSGYQAAVLSMLSAEVHTVERIEELYLSAKSVFKKLGYENIHCVLGDGTLGLPDEAPFDAIIVTAGSPAVPEALLKELSAGGVLIIPVGDKNVQKIVMVKNEPSGPVRTEHTPCVFVPLIGKNGWESDES